MADINHYIYKITNPKTGQYYYGRRSSKFHWSKDNYFSSSGYLKSLCNGKKPTKKRLPDWKKEVLLTFDTLEELITYEEIVVGDRWKNDPLCLNKVPGGEWGGGDASQMHTPENKKKATEGNIKFWRSSEGRKLATELGKRAKGSKKTITQEFSKAQSERSKGRKWINDGQNRKLVKPEEVSKYLSEGWVLGHPQAFKDKISNTLKKRSK